MERIQVFIDKLAAQQQKGDSVDKLLVTVQLLQQELIKNLPAVTSNTSSKVAVVMPVIFTPLLDSERMRVNEAPKSSYEIPESDKRFLPVEASPSPGVQNPSYETEVPKVTTGPSFESYTLRKPQITTSVIPEGPKEIFHLDDTSFDEFTTLMQHVHR